MSDNPIPPYDGGSGVNNGTNTLAWTGGNIALSSSGNVTMNLPTGSLTLPSGTIPSSTGTGATGTWPISISGNSATVTTNANLSGDVTSVGNATTLATVNSSPGSFGDASHSLSATVNGKGLITALSTNSIQISESQVTNLTTDLASKLALAGGTMSGNLILNADPSSSLQAATKNYVDMIAAGLQTKQAVQASSTANIAGTYNNGVSGVGATFTTTATGTFTLDGQTVTASSRYLLKNQSSGFQNGIYDCTVAGSTGIQTVFTRSSDYNTAADMDAGNLVPVINGSTVGGTIWLQTATITTVGTDNLVFSEFGGGPTVLTGDVTGSGFSPTSTTVVQINGEALGSTTPISGNLLIGSGTQWVSNSVQGDVTLDLAGNTSITNGAIVNAKIANATIDMGTKVTGVLQSVNGGTNTAFVAFTGASSSVKTYSLPNANCSVLTTNSAVTEVQGGTNQTSYTLGDTLYSSASNTLSKLAGNTTSTKQYLSQTGTGTVSAAPVWATISGSDITGAALTAANDTNVTLTLGGTPSTSLLRAASITAGWTGTLAASRGGTNVDSSAWSQGDLVYISATGTWNHLAKNTTATRYLANTGTTNNPNWDQINLSNGVANTLGVGNGGTGQTSYTNGQLLIGNTTGNTLALGTLTGTTNQVNVTNGAGSITLSLPQSIASSSSPTFTGLNLSGLTASGLIATDASKNLTSTVSGLSPTFTGLNLSGLTASGLVATDASKNLTSSISGLSPTMTGLNLSGLTASTLIATDGSKNLSSSTTGLTPQFSKLNLGQSSNQGNLTVAGAGGTSSSGFLAYIGSGSGGTTAANLYYMSVDKGGTDSLLMGVNKNTTTGSIPANGIFISSYGTGSTISIGRGAGTGLPSSQDISIDGSGNVGINNGNLTVTSLSSTGGIVVTSGSKTLQTIASTSTYTPTIGDGTNNFTTSTATGNYMLIGNLVWVNIKLVWTSKASAGAGSNVVISLPVTVGASSPIAPAQLGYVSGVGFTGSTLFGSSSSSSASVSLYGISTSGTTTQVIVSQVAASGSFEAALLYTSN